MIDQYLSIGRSSKEVSWEKLKKEEKKGRKCKGIDEGVNADTGETNQRRILFYIVS